MIWLIAGWLSFGGDGDADRVRVILETRCISCHGPEKQKGGLRLDTRDFLLKGGDSGPAARAGDSEHSLLLQAVRHAAGDLKMPPKERLQPDQIDLLGRWINAGLAWSGPTALPEDPSRIGNAWTDPRNPIIRLFDGKRLDLWSLKPVVKPERDIPIDQYIDRSLRAQGLRRSPQADPRTLIRRITLDLTGLPPTPEEITDFLRTPDFEQLVDRLLASPRYGERAARLWLDVVRYADSNGFERDEFLPEHFRYRDYVIRALNTDKPFDLFIREQLSGDEMVSGMPRDAADVDRLIATGYLRMGPYDSTGSIFEENAKNQNELMADLANTTGSAFLGLTMSCANCHDHKYDPISQADHFRLRAFFAGLKRQDDTPIDLEPVQNEIRDHNAPIESRIQELEKAKADRKEIEAAKASLQRPTTAMTARNSDGMAPSTRVFYQGDVTQPRQEVPPGFLSVLDPNPATVVPAGRRSTLAAWIASSENPLTARVIVNRVWQQHFGRGIVATPNDFGYSGARPTHPELLDALAARFVAEGWSLKKLHRRILLSAAYRRSSHEDPEMHLKDPENRLLWRQNPRRLDAESTRDAMLAVSGALLPKDSGPAVWPPVAEELLDAQPGILETHSDQAARDRKQAWYTSAPDEVDVRSVFLVQKRALRLPFLQPFDLPDPTVSCGRRDCTTVATQALQLLNSAFSVRMAETFARRMEAESDPIRAALGRALGREATPTELDLGHRLGLVSWCRVLLNLNEFVYVD
jgi:mono/diheme cytochrome c family protein